MVNFCHGKRQINMSPKLGDIQYFISDLEQNVNRAAKFRGDKSVCINQNESTTETSIWLSWINSRMEDGILFTVEKERQ